MIDHPCSFNKIASFTSPPSPPHYQHCHHHRYHHYHHPTTTTVTTNDFVTGNAELLMHEDALLTYLAFALSFAVIIK